MASPITGLFAFRPSTGAARLVAAKNSGLWTYNGTTSSAYSTVSINTANYVHMLQANDTVYGIDGAGTIFKFTSDNVFSLPTILDASGTALTGLVDILWFQNRLWFVKGDQIHFSDVFDPSAATAIETISDASIRVRQGGGDSICRLVPHRSGQIVVFKRGTTGGGSIHVLDASAGDPDYWQQHRLVDNVNIIAPRTIERIGENYEADILYMTREGVRSLSRTATDKLSTPNPPITDNVQEYLDRVAYTQTDRAFARWFNDEYLLFLPQTTYPDLVLAYNTKVPRNSPLNGWTVIDTIAGSSADVIGFSSAKPSLYFGGNDGNLYKAFASAGTTTTYYEVSRRIVHTDGGVPLAENDKNPRKLIIHFDRGSSGTVTYRLRYQDGTTHIVGSTTLAGGGVLLPALLPAFLSEGSIKTVPLDVTYDTSGNKLLRYKDVRVDIRSSGNPRILGWRLQSLAEPIRYAEISETQGSSVTSANITPDSVTAGTLTMD